MAFTFEQQQQIREVVEGIGLGENWLPFYQVVISIKSLNANR